MQKNSRKKLAEAYSLPHDSQSTINLQMWSIKESNESIVAEDQGDSTNANSKPENQTREKVMKNQSIHGK